MLNWKRLKPCEIANDPEKLDELTESGTTVIHCEAKGDVLPPSWEDCGHFLVNCAGVLMFNGAKGLWTVDNLCERFRVWRYALPTFDGIR